MKSNLYKIIVLLVLYKMVPLPVVQAASLATPVSEPIGFIHTAIKQLRNSRQISNGPNCWNSALFLNRIALGVRYTDAREFSAWLASPLCKKVETPKFGDIIALRNSSGEEVHGMVYLGGGEKSVFSKNGYEPCQYRTYKQQQVNEFYLRWYGSELTSKVYRCVGINEFLAQSPYQSLFRGYLNAHYGMSQHIARMHFSSVDKLDFKVLEDYSLRSQALADEITRTIADRLSRYGLTQEDETIRILTAFRESFNSVNWSISYLEAAYLKSINDRLKIRVKAGSHWFEALATDGYFFSNRPVSQLTTGDTVYVRQPALDAYLAQLASSSETKRNLRQAFKLNQAVVIVGHNP